jgi:hypothetical protein
MGLDNDIEKVNQNIADAFERKIAAGFALFEDEAIRTIQEFNDLQAGGEFWENRTFQAKDRMFTEAFKSDEAIGFIMAHGVQYGVYLELANNRKHQAIRPMIESRLSAFRGPEGLRAGLERIFGADK